LKAGTCRTPTTKAIPTTRASSPARSQSCSLKTPGNICTSSRPRRLPQCHQPLPLEASYPLGVSISHGGRPSANQAACSPRCLPDASPSPSPQLQHQPSPLTSNAPSPARCRDLSLLRYHPLVLPRHLPISVQARHSDQGLDQSRHRSGVQDLSPLNSLRSARLPLPHRNRT
jgi:hypothetical protein